VTPDPQTLLAPALRAARTPAQHEALAAELERIAALIRATGQALRRQQAKPPAKRIGGGKGGRPSAPWVQILRRERATADADSLVIRLSTSLYYAAGSPERLDVQRVGADLLLVPARGDAGYKVTVNAGGIRINASGARDIIGLEDGKYAAAVRGGTIVIGVPLA
jgi:hypothetical protein